MAVLFTNSGLLDTSALTIMGLSVKIGSNPVGYFGTGMKIAIAVLLRNECVVELYVGGKCHLFSTREINFRGETASVIDMTDEDLNTIQLPFGTNLGRDWSPLEAMRELWCNATDEPDGKVEHFDDDTIIESAIGDIADTVFCVRGEAIEETWKQRASMFIHERSGAELVWSDKTVEVWNLGAPSKDVFYRGIRVHQREKESSLVYNFLATTPLAESRQVLYTWYLTNHIAQSLPLTDNPAVAEFLLTSELALEKSLDWSTLSGMSEVFFETAERLRRDGKLSSTARTLFAKARTHYSGRGWTDPTKAYLIGDEKYQAEFALSWLHDGGWIHPEATLSFHSDLDNPMTDTDGRSVMIPVEDAQGEDSWVNICAAAIEVYGRDGPESYERVCKALVLGKWSEDNLPKKLNPSNKDDDDYDF